MCSPAVWTTTPTLRRSIRTASPQTSPMPLPGVALQGGTTTIVDFCTNEPGMNLVDSVNYRLNVRAKGKVAPDIAIHACCNDFTDETVGEIKKLVEMGVPTMKLFLAYGAPPSTWMTASHWPAWRRLASRA